VLHKQKIKQRQPFGLHTHGDGGKKVKLEAIMYASAKKVDNLLQQSI
jgi:hypothetical protein